jgi:flagellar basal-body rod protein FlgG
MYAELYTITSGMMVRQDQMNQLAHNLANSETVGFKMEVMAAREAYVRAPNWLYPFPSQVSSTAPAIDFSQGQILPTGRTLDMALEGKGFFLVLSPQGPRLTRDGRFSLDGNSRLTLNGMPVMGVGGPIKLKKGRMVVNELGEIRVEGQLVDRLRLVDVDDPGRLTKVAPGLFEVDAGAALMDAGGCRVLQGYLERSNVQPLRLMVSLIDVLRTFEMQQRMLQQIDQLNQKAVQTMPKRM